MAFQPNPDLERIKQLHWDIRERLLIALQNTPMAPAGIAFTGCLNYRDFFEKSFNDRFFDMTTMIRLGATIEGHLRQIYMKKKSFNSLGDLRADKKVSKTIFQKIVPEIGQTAGLLTPAQILLLSVGVEIGAMPDFQAIQEIMLHRHLYAHNLGVVDDNYIQKWKQITLEDISDELKKSGYPNQDTYWFRPLRKITDYINHLEKFIRACQ